MSRLALASFRFGKPHITWDSVSRGIEGVSQLVNDSSIVHILCMHEVCIVVKSIDNHSWKGIVRTTVGGG